MCQRMLEAKHKGEKSEHTDRAQRKIKEMGNNSQSVTSDYRVVTMQEDSSHDYSYKLRIPFIAEWPKTTYRLS